MNNITSIDSFSGNTTAIISKTTTGVRLQSAKEFKADYSAKYTSATNKQTKEAYSAYMRKSMGSATMAGAYLHDQGYGVVSRRSYKNGKIVIAYMPKGDEVVEAVNKVNQMTIEQRKAVIASILLDETPVIEA